MCRFLLSVLVFLLLLSPSTAGAAPTSVGFVNFDGGNFWFGLNPPTLLGEHIFTSDWFLP